MRINTNMAALNAWRNLSTNGSNMQKSLEKLSSGYRINRAADDAAGLAVSEKMRAQIRGLNMAQRNAQDAVSMVQTAEGGASKIGDMLQRMRELAVQASSDTLQDTDRALLQKEVDALVAEVDRQATTAVTYNGTKLLDGNFTSKIVQVGANSGDEIQVDFSGLDKATLSIDALTISSQSDAKAALATLDTAISTVNTTRADMGALQNRFEQSIATLQIQSENLTAAESRIRDLDMANEMATFTKFNILQQASTSMLAQANQSANSILSLLR